MIDHAWHEWRGRTDQRLSQHDTDLGKLSREKIGPRRAADIAAKLDQQRDQAKLARSDRIFVAIAGIGGLASVISLVVR